METGFRIFGQQLPFNRSNNNSARSFSGIFGRGRWVVQVPVFLLAPERIVGRTRLAMEYGYG